jgi:hypothetical protein
MNPVNAVCGLAFIYSSVPGVVGQPMDRASMAFMSVSNRSVGGFRWQPGWPANRKIDVVLRLLRGESLEGCPGRWGWRRVVFRRGGTTSWSRARRVCKRPASGLRGIGASRSGGSLGL